MRNFKKLSMQQKVLVGKEAQERLSAIGMKRGIVTDEAELMEDILEKCESKAFSEELYEDPIHMNEISSIHKLILELKLIRQQGVLDVEEVQERLGVIGLKRENATNEAEVMEDILKRFGEKSFPEKLYGDPIRLYEWDKKQFILARKNSSLLL
ncbi:hypothetical protein JTB14_024406 [Gonioctena quinquepunctata]|nr:hypothetical protein JTB14_024406 [Gonioctena quinquepunctata]